jgi:hypothetical protein
VNSLGGNGRGLVKTLFSIGQEELRNTTARAGTVASLSHVPLLHARDPPVAAAPSGRYCTQNVVV